MKFRNYLGSKYFQVFICIVVCLVSFCAVGILAHFFTLADVPGQFMGAFFGAVISALVTMILLNGQTTAEEVKDRNVSVFEKKSKAIQYYIEMVWEIWADKKLSADEFERLTGDYYSRLTIFLQDASINTMRSCLIDMGSLVSREGADIHGEVYKGLRKNIFTIINTLSGELHLGGEINEKKHAELEDVIFPVLFKKALMSELNVSINPPEGQMLKREDELIFEAGEWEILSFGMINGMFASFRIKGYPKTKLLVGPFAWNKKGYQSRDLLFVLFAHNSLSKFDAFRGGRGYQQLIKIDEEVNLNRPFVDDSPAGDYAGTDYTGLAFDAFNLDELATLDAYRTNFHDMAKIIAWRAGYYLRHATIGGKLIGAFLLDSVKNSGKN
jgi:hypothetical protein